MISLDAQNFLPEIKYLLAGFMYFPALPEADDLSKQILQTKYCDSLNQEISTSEIKYYRKGNIADRVIYCIFFSKVYSILDQTICRP